MEEKQRKTLKIVGIIILSIFALFITGFIISRGVLIYNNENKKTYETSSTNEIEKKSTYEEKISKIKSDFNASNVEITDLKEDTYTEQGDCKPLNTALEDMTYSLKEYEKISSLWHFSTYSSYYYKWHRDSTGEYYISYTYDMNKIKSEDEMREVMKDCSQIIWESPKLIYGNENINNKENKFFSKVKFIISNDSSKDSSLILSTFLLPSKLNIIQMFYFVKQK